MDVNTLWKKYATTHSTEDRNALIEHYAPLVKVVAGRLSMYVGNHVEYDDLCSYGSFGLIDAISKFDYTKGIKFETYATIRIRGEIIDQIRRFDWLPKALRELQKNIDTARQELFATLGREPSDEELANALDLSLEAYYDKIEKLKIKDIISLESLLETEYEPIGSQYQHRFDTPEEAYNRQELVQIVEQSMGVLTEKEKQVLLLFYYEDLTQKEIAETLGVSESRVSQLHTRVLSKMRGPLSKYLNVSV